MIDAVVKHEGEGINVGSTSIQLALNTTATAESLLDEVDLCDQELVTGLSSYHWPQNQVQTSFQCTPW